MASSLRDRLLSWRFNGPVLLDGGTGSLLLGQLGSAALSAGVTTAVLNLSSPDLVQAAHRKFLTAGAEIILANSFGASRPYLKSLSLAGQIEEINREAVKAAREAIRSVGRSGDWIAGSIAPLAPTTNLTDQQDIFREQALLLLKGGVDMLVCETFMELAQVQRAVAGCRLAMSQAGMDVPLVVSMVPMHGSNLQKSVDHLATLRRSGEVDLIGVNCGSGVGAAREWMEAMVHLDSGPFWLKPSGGLPDIEGKSVSHTIEVDRFAKDLIELVKTFPVAAVGGCCGITPECIGDLNERLGHIFPKDMAKT